MSVKRKGLTVVACLLRTAVATGPSLSLLAQGPAPSARPIVALDAGSRTLTPPPPFDQEFLLKIPKIGAFCARRVLVGLATPPLESGVTFIGDPKQDLPRRDDIGNRCEGDVHFLVAPLDPNRRYLIKIEYVNAAENHRLDSLAMVTVARADLTAHFDADLGGIWAPRPGPALVAMSSNLHFYFVPINKSETISNRNDSIRDWVFKRFSIFAGLSAVRLISGSPIENRVTNGNPVIGIGLKPRFSSTSRRFDFFRLTAGFLYYAQKDPNPIVTTKHPKKAPFIGLTGDVEIEKVLAPLGALLGLK